MKAPFARWPASAIPTAIEAHQWYVVDFECLIRHSGRADQKMVGIAAAADIARRPRCQLASPKLAAGRDQCGAWILVRHCGPLESAYRFSRPGRVAGQTPRSVINAVTNLAGVTSNARLRAALVSGTTRTVSMFPEAPRPVTCVSSSGERSSMTISPPVSNAQSIVLRGSAA